MKICGLGIERDGGSFSAGSARVKSWLAESTGHDDGIVIRDGSGTLSFEAADGMDCCQLGAKPFKSAELTVPPAVKSPVDQSATS